MAMKWLSVVLFFFPQFVTAQNAFQKNYGDTSGNVGLYFLPTIDSGYCILGTLSQFHQSESFQITKIDQSGDSLTTFDLQTGIGRSVVCTNSKNYFVIATVRDSVTSQLQYLDTLFINRFDVNGNSISSWQFPDTMSFYIPHIMETSDGGYLFGAGCWNYPVSSTLMLMKVDSAGVVQWKKQMLPFDVYRPEYVIEMMETGDHHYILEIEQASGSNWTGNKLMVKTDTSGNILWNTMLTYGYPGGNVHQIIAKDSGYMYLDNISFSLSSDFFSRLSFVDSGGTLTWSRVYSEGSNYSEIIQGDDNEYYMVQTQHSPGDIVVTKIGSNLDSLSSCIYGFTGTNEYVKYFTLLHYSRFACLGFSRWGTNSLNDDIYFLISDSMMADRVNMFEQQDKISLAPNPTSGKLSIVLPGLREKTTIEIYSPWGERVFQILNVGHESKLDISGLASGAYIIQANCGEKVYRGKVIKE